MRNPSEKEEVQKDSVLEKCFACMVENGIEQISIREFSKATGMTTSSLYYWFKDKDEIILDATEYGIGVIVSKFFEFAMNHINSLSDICMGLAAIAKEQQPSMKILFQVVASPKYGPRITELSEHTIELFDTYANKLKNYIDVPYSTIRTVVDLCISSIIDCTLWSEWDKLTQELEFLMSIILSSDS